MHLCMLADDDLNILSEENWAFRLFQGNCFEGPDSRAFNRIASNFRERLPSKKATDRQNRLENMSSESLQMLIS